jgi:hypothetical protein
MVDLSLMGILADTNFVYDARGRMVRINSPEGRPAPRVFLGRTMAGHVVRVGQALPDVLMRRIVETVEGLPAVDELPVTPAIPAAIREALEADAPIEREGSGPNYRFPEPIASPNGVVRITWANIAVVRETFLWLLTELANWWPCFAVVREGAAVSVCFSSRIVVAAAAAGVETLPEFRGRGYAVAVPAAWGASVRAGSHSTVRRGRIWHRRGLRGGSGWLCSVRMRCGHSSYPGEALPNTGGHRCHRA